MSTEHEKLLNRIRSKRYYWAHLQERRVYHRKWVADHHERRLEISQKYDRKMGKIPREEYRKICRERSNPLAWRGRTWWKLLSIKIKTRDGYQCKRCGITRGHGVRIAVHHLVPVAVRENNSDKNLITLCNRCHLSVHRRKDRVFLYA